MKAFHIIQTGSCKKFPQVVKLFYDSFKEDFQKKFEEGIFRMNKNNTMWNGNDYLDKKALVKHIVENELTSEVAQEVTLSAIKYFEDHVHMIV
jgi:hypothetical protein